jgi:predicted nucleic acid-binding protein
MASLYKRGHPGNLGDITIGIALAHYATLATRNITHFADSGVFVVNS